MALGDAGLFDTKNLSRARAAMAMEDEARGQLAYKQAMPEGINAARVARATQNLQNLGKNVTVGMFGSDDPDGILPNDPRLIEGQSKDVFMNTMVKKYQNAAESDGKITPVEYQDMINDFVKGGYVKEAKEIADIMETESKAIENLTPTGGAKALAGGGQTIKDKAGNVWRSVLFTNGQVVHRLLTGDPNAKYNSEGAAVVDAKEEAKSRLKTKNSYLTTGLQAGKQLPKTQRLLELAERIRTGGFASAVNDIKKYFGWEVSDVAEFRTESKLFLVKNLKRIMGARPTDTDLIELNKALANLTQSQEANVSILKQYINQLNIEIRGGDYFADPENRNKDLDSFFLYERNLDNQEPVTLPKNDPVGIR
jgi:hypothetical protein|tara:strand:+ start:779 stop:1879 length:1101 start_codon:yes stop_codon:yes gene_type:complete